MADIPALCGLGLDIGGVVLLARGIAFDTTEHYVQAAYDESRMYALEGNKVGADMQRADDVADTRTGLGLIVAGFALQFVGGVQSEWGTDSLALFLPLSLFIAGAATLLWSALREKELHDIYVDRMRRCRNEVTKTVAELYAREAIRGGRVSAATLWRWTEEAKHERGGPLWDPEYDKLALQEMRDVEHESSN